MNIAQANGGYSELDHHRFFDVAATSAVKSAADLDLAVQKVILGRGDCTLAEELLERLQARNRVNWETVNLRVDKGCDKGTGDGKVSKVRVGDSNSHQMGLCPKHQAQQWGLSNRSIIAAAGPLDTAALRIGTSPGGAQGSCHQFW